MKRMYPLIIVVMFFAACNGISARAYNNMMVEKEKALVPQITLTEESVGKFAQQGKFDSVAAVSKRMESAVSKAISEIERAKVSPAKGAEEFKTAYVEYLRFIKSLYTTYKNYGLAKTTEERTEVARKIQEVIAKKTEVIATMQAAQKKFAAENNLTVNQK